MHKSVIRENGYSLRPTAEDDIEFLRTIRSKERVHRHLPHGVITPDDQRRWWSTVYVPDARQQRFIVDNNDVPIGEVSLVDIDFQRGFAEGGIVLDPKSWGYGNADHAANLLGTYLFHLLGLESIFARTKKANVFAQRLFHRVGLDTINADEFPSEGLAPLGDDDLCFRTTQWNYRPDGSYEFEPYFDCSDLAAFPK